MYSLDTDTRTVTPFGVSFRDVIAGKDTLSEFVRSIVSDDDKAAIFAACAESIAEDFESDRADAQGRAVARKFAAFNGHDKVEGTDVQAARDWLATTAPLAETAVMVLGESDKSSVSLPMESVRVGDRIAEVRVVVAFRDYGKPARVIDPNCNNGL